MQTDWWAIGAAIFVPFVAWYLNESLRPKLIAWFVNASAVTVNTPQQPITVHTHTFVVSNQGRRTATNVRLGHAHLPQSFSVFPGSVQFMVVPKAGVNNAEITFPALVPKEQVSITYLYYFPLTFQGVNTYVKSDEVMGRIVNVWTTIRYPTWALSLFAFFLLLGMAAAVYGIIEIVRRVAGI